MLTVQNLIFAIALVLFAWYIAGLFLNRSRANKLIAAIRQAVPQIGAKPTIKWFGRSAFQVDVTQPVAPLTAFRLLCLLEPREFALAMLWSRLRGRRDQVMFQADLKRPPAKASQPDAHDFAVPGLTFVSLGPEPPHLQITVQVGGEGEAAIAEGFALVAQLAGRPAAAAAPSSR